jgi:hypothetical protein
MNILRYILGLAVLVVVAAVGELVSNEIRARLDRIPLAVLAAAARRLPKEQRAELYGQAWLPELRYILQGDESMPITRLVHGMRYALRLWFSAPKISCEINGDAARKPISRLLSMIFRPSFRTAMLLNYLPVGAVIISNTVAHGSWVATLMVASSGTANLASYTFVGRWLVRRGRRITFTWRERRGAAPLRAAIAPTALVLTWWAAVAPLLNQHGSLAHLLTILTPGVFAIFLSLNIFGFAVNIETRQGDIASTASTA